jgi:hypothetical protein
MYSMANVNWRKSRSTTTRGLLEARTHIGWEPRNDSCADTLFRFNGASELTNITHGEDAGFQIN